MDIHRCRFVPYPSSTINALAFSHTSSPNLPSKGPPNLRLAVGRANGDIEIWNPQRGAWYQESILRGGKDRSIEGLVWTHDPEDVDKHGHKTAGKLRLFSIGYSTAVTEWDLALGRPARHSAGNYGEIWCMAAQPKDRPIKPPINGPNDGRAREEEESQMQNIAVGCADGAIILLNTAEDDLRFSRILARPSKKKSRVLSITFQDRFTIVAGHADSTIRVYDVRNRQQMRNMTLGAGPKGGPKETLVWSVKCLGDGTIVSGDSTGTVSFWDGKIYSLLQRIKGHEADILDVAVSADGQSVFSGGMDRRTTMYKRSASGEKLRWAKIAHQRFHKHDVKAMATFEAKTMSVLASGGPDTAPIIVPIQEFGRENHRTLSSLPQQPILQSSTRKRLVVSWWDHEISIWNISKSRSKGIGEENPSKTRGPEGRKLVAKIVLQGEESITSAELASDGAILAVSTMAELRFFQVRVKNDTLKIQKLQAPPEMVRIGAKSVHISPDQRWLAVTRTDDNVFLYRITESGDTKRRPQLLSKVVQLKRLPRDPIKSNYQHGTLGNYNRSIIRLAFSADSRILAVGDLSGWLDTWVLEGHEDLTQDRDEDKENPRMSETSDDDRSDEDSDEEEHATVILGQHWIRNPSASLLIRLPAPPLVLSFRPSSTQSGTALANGNPGVHPTRHTPHPHFHDLPDGEDRLLVLTTENQMYEFNVLPGRMSDWSRRNPASSFPREFRNVRDRAMGVLWDVQGQNQRIWLYGVSWLWMFDLSIDLPAAEDQDRTASTMNVEHKTNQLKRKRLNRNDDDDLTARSKHDTGAGSKISKSKLGLGIGSEIHKIKGEGREELITLAPESSTASDEDDDLVLANENDSTLISLQRSAQDENHSQQGSDEGESDVNGETSATEERQMSRRKKAKIPSHWHTYKYRPILGIVPIGSRNDDEAAKEDDSQDGSPSGLEVVLVERPLWDVDLPPQYYGNQEWDP